MAYNNRLRSDELKYECGVRGRRQVGDVTVASMRKVLAALLAEEGNGVEHPDALLPVDVEEELSVMDAKLTELSTTIEVLAEEADDSSAARVRALMSHSNRRLSRLLGHCGAGERGRVKGMLTTLKEAVHKFRLAGEGAVYNASSVSTVSSESSVASAHTVHSPPPSVHSASSVSSVNSDKTVVSSTSAASKAKAKEPKVKSIAKKPIDFQKWGLTYSGAENTSVLSFILDAEEKAESRGLDKKYLLRGVPEFLTGRAKVWFRTVKEQIDSWEEMKTFLRTEFLPVDYSDNLWEEVRGRLQGEQESIGCYIANMLSLFERLALMGRIKEEVKLNIIVKNLAPFYVKGLVNTKVLSISHLRSLGRDLENAKFRVERYDSSRRTPLMEPEFAYKGKGKKVLVHEAVTEPEVAAVRGPGGRPPLSCWRCSAPGHRFRECSTKGDFPRFCYGCGKKEVVLTTCPTCRNRPLRPPRVEADAGASPGGNPSSSSWDEENPW
ncbi:Activity-regulated cytoskeleton associated protein 2 [Frankliniella fusca]|uniref:Activity-regulated cytoskeleton associated protein 2 n=1 Tax=Frankliniella fusca TaxID=407009 RepID=A0AAE1LE67_9NEOP|nr:Activity-regulated cytoskeleton associated protein 2 [Frankliniella fusca]